MNPHSPYSQYYGNLPCIENKPISPFESFISKENTRFYYNKKDIEVTGLKWDSEIAKDKLNKIYTRYPNLIP